MGQQSQASASSSSGLHQPSPPTEDTSQPEDGGQLYKLIGCTKEESNKAITENYENLTMILNQTIDDFAQEIRIRRVVVEEQMPQDENAIVFYDFPITMIRMINTAELALPQYRE